MIFHHPLQITNLFRCIRKYSQRFRFEGHEGPDYLACKQGLLTHCDSPLGQRRVDGLVKTYYGTRLLGYLFRFNGSAEAIFYLGYQGQARALVLNEIANVLL